MEAYKAIILFHMFVQREGLSQYNKIYEFDTEVNGQRAQMVMTSVSGHLLGLDFIGTYKSWQACSPLMLFEAPVAKYCPENYVKIKVIKSTYQVYTWKLQDVNVPPAICKQK